MTTLNPFIFVSLSVIATVLPAAAQLPVGAPSDDTPFAVFADPGSLENQHLTDHAGKVVILMYFTPW